MISCVCGIFPEEVPIILILSLYRSMLPGPSKRFESRASIASSVLRRPAGGMEVVKNMKQRLEIRNAAVEHRLRQQQWLKVVALITRSSNITHALENKRRARLQRAVMKHQRSAVRRLELYVA